MIQHDKIIINVVILSGLGNSTTDETSFYLERIHPHCGWILGQDLQCRARICKIKDKIINLVASILGFSNSLYKCIVRTLMT